MRKWANPETICGIYRILNSANNYSYIGASEDIYKRWYDHINLLNKNNHRNKNLQKDWNDYGEECFKFEILEVCMEQDLDKLETDYIKKEKTNGTSYNVLLGGRRSSWLGVNLSDDTKSKLSEANKGSKNPMFGKTGSKNSFFGKHHDEKTKNKMSENHADFSGKNNPRFSKKLPNTSSKYMGVTFVKRFSKWVVRITVDGKRIYLGKFSDEIDAAKAYDKYIEDNMLDYPKNFL